MITSQTQPEKHLANVKVIQVFCEQSIIYKTISGATSSEMENEPKRSTTFNNTTHKLSRPIRNTYSETLRKSSYKDLIKCEFYKWNYKWRDVRIILQSLKVSAVGHYEDLRENHKQMDVHVSQFL